MITGAFIAMSEVNQTSLCDKTTPCIFNSDVWTKPRGEFGVVLICIAVMLAIIIILTKALNTASTRNTIIMIITLIMMTIGVVLLAPFGTRISVKFYFLFRRSSVGTITCLLLHSQLLQLFVGARRCLS
ncbi:unnamed protein product [Schistosoma turkestanicum]|nr:unnamed protein product [Schistosoma turkestanicum]